MLDPVKVVNPRVMAEQYPEKDQRQRRKSAGQKAKPKPRSAPGQDGARIDFTV
jgi:hypothetical protein